MEGIELICESCGVGNPPGTEFCQFCGAYLAWDRSVVVRPQAGASPGRGQAGPPPVPPPAQAQRPVAGRPTSSAPPPVVAPTAAVEAPWLEAAKLKSPKPHQAQPSPTPYVDPPTVPVQAAMPSPTSLPPTQQNPGWTPAEQPHPYGAPGAAPPAYPAGQPVPGGPCPRCGRVNDPKLRFCGKCGLVLIADQAGVAGAPARQPATQMGWWQRLWDSHDRAARRAYRRSLPPLYRWRRVLIVLVILVLGTGGAYALGRHPVRWLIERWYDLRNATEIVPGVQAKILPPQATAPGSDPAALTDGSIASWAMVWKPKQEGGSCGGAAGTGVIVLKVPSTRVREIEIAAGLPADDPVRQLQFRPKSIGISFDGGVCRNFPLQDLAGPQTLEVDSQVPIRTIQIGVDVAYPAPADGQALLSITEVMVKTRPRAPG